MPFRTCLHAPNARRKKPCSMQASCALQTEQQGKLLPQQQSLSSGCVQGRVASVVTASQLGKSLLTMAMDPGFPSLALLTTNSTLLGIPYDDATGAISCGQCMCVPELGASWPVISLYWRVLKGHSEQLSGTCSRILPLLCVPDVCLHIWLIRWSLSMCVEVTASQGLCTWCWATC